MKLFYAQLSDGSTIKKQAEKMEISGPQRDKGKRAVHHALCGTLSRFF